MLFSCLEIHVIVVQRLQSARSISMSSSNAILCAAVNSTVQTKAKLCKVYV